MKKVRIRAEPRIGLIPGVRLSARDASANTGQTIRWRLKKAKGFVFHDFGGGGAFKNVVKEDKVIVCTFEPPEADPPNTSYPYTITIKKGADELTTTEPVITPTGGRAVIRN